MSQSQLSAMPLRIDKSRRLWMAILLGSFAAIAPLSTDMYLPSLPALAEDLQSNTSVAQLTLTANLLGLGLGQLWLGTLSDQRGRRMPLIISLAVYCLSSFLCTIAPSIELLIILRFIQGVSGAGGMVISRAIVRDLYSGSELTKFFALVNADQWGGTYFGTSHWWAASAVYLLAWYFCCIRDSRNPDDLRS